MKIHKFESTGEAYDCVQCREDIKDGDILVIEYEKVVGIADTWPISITKEYGNLHILNAGADPFKYYNEESIRKAILSAELLGYEIRPEFK